MDDKIIDKISIISLGCQAVKFRKGGTLDSIHQGHSQNDSMKGNLRKREFDRPQKIPYTEKNGIVTATSLSTYPQISAFATIKICYGNKHHAASVKKCCDNPFSNSYQRF